MATRPVGTLYEDWRKAEHGITALEQELAREQITHIDLADYQQGAPHYEQLMRAIEQQVRFQWPSMLTENV